MYFLSSYIEILFHNRFWKSFS